MAQKYIHWVNGYKIFNDCLPKVKFVWVAYLIFALHFIEPMSAANKYDIFIKEFLSINKLISFEKIGTLVLESNTRDGVDASPVIQGNFSFGYNKKAQTSDELITFIAEKTLKAKTLIASDIYSYLDQAREMMNTGKAWILFGVGIFSINMAGEYQFDVADFKPEDSKHSRKERPQKGSDRNRDEKNGHYALRILTFFIIAALIAGLIWVAYEYFLKDKFTDWTDSAGAGNQTAQTIVDTALPNSGANGAGNTAPFIINPGDSVSFAFIFETTPSLTRARQRTATLKGYGNDAGYDSIKNNTGTFYNIYIQKKATVADTSAIRDSLSKFLKLPIQIHILMK